MKRLSAALLAIGLVSSSAAFAQSTYYPSNGYQSNTYPSNSYPTNGGYNDRYQDDYRGNAGYQQGEASYDYARVIRVDPVTGSSRGTAAYGNQRCYESQSAGGYQSGGYYGNGNDGYRNDSYGNGGYYGNDPYRSAQNGSNTGRSVATVLGGIAGAVLGSKIGGGTGSYAATAIGSMVGGMAGRQVYEQTQRNRYTPQGVVRVCDPEPVGRDGYNRVSDGRSGAYDVTYEYNGRRYTRRMDYNPGNRVRVRVDVTPQ